jgi:hypothetical protein
MRERDNIIENLQTNNDNDENLQTNNDNDENLQSHIVCIGAKSSDSDDVDSDYIRQISLDNFIPITDFGNLSKGESHHNIYDDEQKMLDRVYVVTPTNNMISHYYDENKKSMIIKIN